jgi:hypothetical protein
MPLIEEGVAGETLAIATLWSLIMLRTRELIAVCAGRLVAKKALVVLVIAIGFPGSLMLMASAANAQDPRSAMSMAA